MSPATAPRRRTRLLVGLVALALAFTGFVALGVWQLERMVWKHDLIARVESRLAAEPVPPPGPPQWPSLTRAEAEYRRVALQGRFDHTRETRVRASTELGLGWWLVTPLKTDAGWWLLVNRGFVPAAASTWARPEGEQRLVGLLRFSEPGGTWLQSNQPAEDRWFSRDVEAIAGARRLGGEVVAPYFVDASAVPGASPERETGWPRAGLTVVRFNDNHLGYALTWFALAAMCIGAAVLLWRTSRGRRPFDDDDAAEHHPDR